MTTKFLYKVSDVKRLIKIWLFIIVSLAIYIFSSKTHANSIEFDDNILNLFPWITGYTNSAHFAYWGNDFAWIFFLLSPWYSWDSITLWAQTKTCSKQIKWLYYNDQRWFRLRPLDQQTLQTLQIASITWYNNLTMSGWWYTLCSGSSPDEVYWQITHDRYNWTIFKMIAWVNYDFTNNSYTGWFSWTFKFFNNTTWYFRDQRWWVADFWWTWVPALTQTGICTWVVTSWAYYSWALSYSITQTRNWSIWNPTTWWVYTWSPAVNWCNFNCISWYQRSWLISQCTLVIWTYCGDWIIQSPNSWSIYEQCDDHNLLNWDWCSSSCLLEVPSCSLINNSPKYTGQQLTFTWNTFSGRVVFDWLAFGDWSTWTRASNTTWVTQVTWHSYSNSWTYTSTLRIKNILSGAITNSCTSSVTIRALTGTYCGDWIIQTPNSSWTNEQCDYNNSTHWSSCNTNCTWRIPSCTWLTVTPNTGAIPLTVTFGWIKDSRANYTLNFGTWTSTWSFSFPLTNIYTSTWTFTYSLTWINIYSWAFNCIQTWVVTPIYTWLICRSWWINLSWTCTLISTWNTSITWTLTSWSTFSIPWNITIYSSWSNTGWYIQISWINSVWISYGNRNWIIIPPTILSGWSCSIAVNTLMSISSWLTNPSVILEFQAWASGSTVTSNTVWWYFTIKVKVNSWTIWNTYRVFRSADCLTWREKVYIDEICILDSNKMCEFRTNKLSYFNIVSNNILWWWTPMIVWTIPRLRNTQIDKAYMSDPFTVANFNDIAFATVTKGMLYINWDPIWTGWYVKNWDELNIELYSSKKYDTTISSKITVWSVSATFYITTMLEWDDNTNDLSNLQKIRIMSIFNLLIDLYSDNPAKEQEFLYTLRSMLTDRLNGLNTSDDSYSTFEYLLSLIEARLLTSAIDESNHIAPNCKEYQVKFETNEKAYYSPDFKKVQYFSTRESLTRYIDSKNPWDCRINTYWSSYIDTTNTDSSKHIAPNGKVYTIESSNNWYTSPDLSSTKYFDTLAWLRAYLNIRNPATAIRDHTLDTSFTAVNYIAPNGKVYKIYKTDKWYMSYKLIKVRYFTTLESIKSFINQNNKI